LSQRENAADFVRKARSETVPDIIVCGYPSIELADAGSTFAKRHSIPMIVDCRDMWPDIIAENLSPVMRIAARPALAYWSLRKRKIMESASSIVGITEAFVQWGLRAAGRPRSAHDVPFHLAVQSDAPSSSAAAAANKLWHDLLGPKPENATRLAFAGTLSRRLPIMQFIQAFKSKPHERLQLVLCGRGDLDKEIAEAAAGQDNIVFAGWRSQAEIAGLMQSSDIGVLPYPNAPDFQASYPNKLGEYLSYGLPVLTGLDGMTGALLRTHDVGYTHANDRASIVNVLDALNAGARPTQSQRDRALQVYRSQFDPLNIYPAFAHHVESVALLKQVVPLRHQNAAETVTP
jgi:glycosyltransferase involved in cell wall biosynthesis